MIRRLLMTITDVGMLLYWGLTVLVALSLVNIPPEYLFSDYYDPQVTAWNWSFFPLDILLALTGLYSLRLERRGDPAWRLWSAISMTLTVCAGLMAISYWAIIGDFDPAWWIPNLFLMIWPLPFLWQLSRNWSA